MGGCGHERDGGGNTPHRSGPEPQPAEPRQVDKSSLLCRQLEDRRSSGPRVQMQGEEAKEPQRAGGEWTPTSWHSVLSQVTPDSGQESPGRVWVWESTWVGQGLLLRAQEGLQVPGRLRIDPSLP